MKSRKALFLLGVRVIEERLIKLIKAGEHRRFYKRKEWKRKRKQVLKRDNYECQRCKDAGEFSQAECVHHMYHLEERPDLALTDSNLASLCNACHNYFHPEKLKSPEIDRREHITEERW